MTVIAFVGFLMCVGLVVYTAVVMSRDSALGLSGVPFVAAATVLFPSRRSVLGMESREMGTFSAYRPPRWLV